MTPGVNKHRENIEGSKDAEASHKGNQHSVVTIDEGSKNTSGEKTVEIDKLKNRTRAFTGAFVGMVSPVLMAIVLKKTNLKGVGKYQGTRMLGDFVDLFQEFFPLLAAITLQVGMMPFLCLMVSEACVGLPDRVNHITKRLLITSKMVVFFSNILLMLLGCGVLVFIHKNARFSWLVVSACFIMAVIVILLHICSCCWWYRQDDKNVGCTEDYHSKLEHSLEFSAGITAMMFLVLGSVVLEGLLRSTQLPEPDLAPTPSEGPTTKEPGMFLGATLFLSFLTSMIAAFLMNVWTIPLVVSAGAHVRGFNIALATLAVMVVFLITWEGLQLKAWLTLLAPAIILLVLLKRCNGGDGNMMQHQEEEKGEAKGKGKELEEAALPTPDGKIQQQEKIKPAPLELTKVAFTGFLAVAVSGITSASPGAANKVFVFCAAATVVLGLLWRLLTHDDAPSPAVRKAVNHSSFLAQVFLFCAGISFGVMAVNAAK